MFDVDEQADINEHMYTARAKRRDLEIDVTRPMAHSIRWENDDADIATNNNERFGRLDQCTQWASISVNGPTKANEKSECSVRWPIERTTRDRSRIDSVMMMMISSSSSSSSSFREKFFHYSHSIINLCFFFPFLWIRQKRIGAILALESTDWSLFSNEWDVDQLRWKT